MEQYDRVELAYQRWKAGDNRGAAEMIRLFNPLLQRASKYAANIAPPGMGAEDFYQLACEALVRAMNAYDPNGAAKISRFIQVYVENEMRYNLMMAPREMSVYRGRRQKKMFWHAKRMAEEKRLEGKMWGEIAQELAAHFNVPEDEVDAFFTLMTGRVSKTAGSGEPFDFDTVRGQSPDGLEAVEKTQHARILSDLYDAANLTPRERAIVEAYNEEGVTLEALAAQHGMSRERVRQLNLRALARLKAAAAGLGLEAADCV